MYTIVMFALFAGLSGLISMEEAEKAKRAGALSKSQWEGLESGVGFRGKELAIKMASNDDLIDRAVLEASIYPVYKITVVDPLDVDYGDGLAHYEWQHGKISVEGLNDKGKTAFSKYFDIARVYMPVREIEEQTVFGETGGTLGRVKVFRFTSRAGCEPSLAVEMVPFKQQRA